MAQLTFGDITYNETAYDYGYDQFQQTTWDVVKAAAEEAWEFNPTISVMKYFDMERSRMREKELEQEPISKDQLNAEYSDLGLYFEEDEYGSVVDIIVQQKQEERRRQSIMQRGPQTIGATAAKLGAGLAASVPDFANLVGFLPVFGQARFARLAARFTDGKVSALSKARFIRGTAEGAFGAALVEPIVYNVAQELQADYTMMDSFMNITFGSLIGGGLHVGFGKLKEAGEAWKFKRDLRIKKEKGELIEGSEDPKFNPYRKYYKENAAVMRELAETDPATRRLLLEKAGYDLLTEQAPDITPVLDKAPKLKEASQLGEGPNRVNQMMTDQERSRTDLNNQEQNVVDKQPTDIDADIETLSNRLNQKRVEQSNIEIDPDPELKATLQALDEINTKSEDLDNIIRDAINCVNGR
jgi:hypothetical protein